MEAPDLCDNLITSCSMCCRAELDTINSNMANVIFFVDILSTEFDTLVAE